VVLYVAFGILLNVLYDVAAFAAAYALLRRLQKKALAEPIGEVSP
jgi:hypothetical protein